MPEELSRFDELTDGIQEAMASCPERAILLTATAQRERFHQTPRGPARS